MIRFPRSRVTKALTSFLYVLASFTIVIFITGAINTALAADNPKSADKSADAPKTADAKSSQSTELEIPGSFKDLSIATDPVTTKRSPESIAAMANNVANNSGSIALTIDAEKAAATSAARMVKPAAISAKREKATVSGGADAFVAPYAETDLVDFNATAYCLKGRTASGADARPGMIAADPRVLPLGTVVHLRSGSYTGTYKVMDTGGRIKGRRVDVYVATHREAVQFGRRQVKIKVLGHGPAKSDRASKNLIASEQ